MTERTHTRDVITRWFYAGAAVLLCLFCIVAFAPSMVYPAGRSLPLPLSPLTTAHAMLGVCWLFVFVIQVVLVARGRTSDHRRLGIIGIVLIGLFLVTGVVTVLVQARRGYDASGDLVKLPLPPGTDVRVVMLGQLYFLVVFGVLTGLGIWYRRRPAVHKRLMLLGIVGGLIPTPVAHLIGHYSVLHPWTVAIFQSSLVFGLALILIRDLLSDGRFHPLSLWGAVGVFGSNFLFNVVVMPSAAWSSFGEWILGIGG